MKLSDPTESKDGEKSYHLPNKTQVELIEEVSKIEGAVKNPPSKDGKSQIIRLPDGKWINTYPRRSSTGGPGWEIHMNPNPKSKPTYKGDTKK